MNYERIWCEKVLTDLDFNLISNLELLIVLVENNDCAIESICTNQCYEVHLYSEIDDTLYIYKSNIGLENIFNTIYIKHCKEEE